MHPRDKVYNNLKQKSFYHKFYNISLVTPETIDISIVYGVTMRRAVT